MTMTDNLEEIKTILDSPSVDLFNFIEAESIYKEQIIRLQQPDGFEDHSEKLRRIDFLKKEIRKLQLENERTQLLDVNKQKILELTDIEMSGTADNILQIQNALNDKIDTTRQAIDRNGVIPEDDKKGKSTEKLLVKRLVMGIQSQVKDYNLYKQRQQNVRKLPFGLQCVYNDLVFILTSAKTFKWEGWFGFDVNVTDKIEFVNKYDKISISFALEGDTIKFHYLDKIEDAHAPYYTQIAQLLNLPVQTASTQNMEQ